MSISIVGIFTLLVFTIYMIYTMFNTRPERLYHIDQCSLSYDRDKIYEFDNLLTPGECQEIMDMSRSTLNRSTVMSHTNIQDVRTSSHTFLPTRNNTLLQKIDRVVFEYLQIPTDHYEDLQVVHYKPTQKYNAHYDACDTSEDICKQDIKNKGSLRYATFIIYLNDDFTGGETEFPKYNFKAKPKTGKGVLFFNLTDDNLKQRYKSLHGGLPPLQGEKWMCNKWIRLKPVT